MERVLESIDYKNIFKYFEEISRIPRGSGNNKKISDYLCKFAAMHNLKYVQDEALNVIIYKDATPGLEDVPGIIIQGHMDMVCEKDPDSEHDFENDALELIIEDGNITANGTTLGADDGIGVAYALAILEDDSLKHPAIEVLITTDEEVGMDGAIALDASLIHGKYLINLDSEDEGTILSSCAGGLTTDCTMPINRISKEGIVFNIELKGLKGGHSGTEIGNKGKNATILLSRLLYNLNQYVNFELIDLCGGQKDNVIPNAAKSKVSVTRDKLEEFINNYFYLTEQLIEEHSACEPNMEFLITDLHDKVLNKANPNKNNMACTEDMVLDRESFDKVMKCLQLLPNGVQVWSSSIEGLVESSLNVGIMKLTDTELVTSHSVRSSINTYKFYIYEKLNMLFSLLGGKAEKRSEYPAWEYRENSYLREVCQNVYRNMYGRNARIEAIHAGLECGILSGKLPYLDMVSFGPDMKDIHTTGESLNIESTKRVYDFIHNIIESIVR